MSFGFSVGDFIAVGSIINTIVGSLNEAGGSKSDYQELLRELESLQQALHHLDRLQLGDACSTDLDSIKYAALSCRRPLEQFLAKIEKYDKSLGVWSDRSALRGAADKVRWAFGQKDEIRRLQSYLNVHVGTINMLLAEHGLAMMNITSEKVEADRLDVRERLDSTRKVIEWIKNSVSTQALAVHTTHSMLLKLYEMATGDFMTSWRSFGEMVEKVRVSTQQIYTVVLEMKSSLPLGDTRWTYFQEPLIVEDALGFKFPVPSEYDYELLNNIVKHRFTDGPGSSEVEAGNYELSNTKNSQQVISANMWLLPGTSITMAILVRGPKFGHEECPMPRCRSIRTTIAPGGGRLCCECNVWFDRSTKRFKVDQEILAVDDQQLEEPVAKKRKLSHEDRPRKRLKRSSVEDNISLFKNVRCLLEESPNEIQSFFDDEAPDGMYFVFKRGSGNRQIPGPFTSDSSIV